MKTYIDRSPQDKKAASCGQERKCKRCNSDISHKRISAIFCCKKCKKKYHAKSSYSKWRLKNIQHLKQYRNEWSKNNPEKQRRYAAKEYENPKRKEYLSLRKYCINGEPLKMIKRVLALSRLVKKRNFNRDVFDKIIKGETYEAYI
jgi:hypothetical protein